ncbi:L-type lectin-domain containing receptor kinase I.9 [Brachypodium distachyon]|uniref:L-type lectin-domain containing receptor kinase I.9 n=1 Tax=Brachypodium distachyon TaxID=15368 RepID=UPI0001C7628A|nr:L-type lectin-domain containing receptor kinase I.9 [Brachypodium distachyon]|eukprot:XP_003561539.1 L-type lectin-domain containing receptor kinase I.9 [Brachypodium distachyon]
MVLPPLLILLLLLPSAAVASNSKVRHSSFALDFFPGDGALAQLALTGGANATSAGAISMASPHARVQYHKPILLAKAAGFSTYFSFSLQNPIPKSKSKPLAAGSLKFFLAPAVSAPTDALAVVFSVADVDPSHVRVQIDLPGVNTAVVQARFSLPVSRAQKLHSWIDYNATSAALQVRLSSSRVPKPPHPLLSHPLHLRPQSSTRMLAGFASSHANCSLFSWAFKASSGPPYLMHSLPLDPTGGSILLTTPPLPHYQPPLPYRYHWPSLLLAAACGAMLTFFVLFVWYSVATRRPIGVTPVEYPMHPSSSDIVYEKIVLVGAKDHPANAAAPGNK